MVTAATFTESHQQALELDLWILSSTLSHGRSSHGRTIHFQRLQMAKSCFLRHRLNVLATEWQDFSDQVRADFKQQSGVSKRKSENGRPKSVRASDTGIDQEIGHASASRLQTRLKDLRDRLLSGSNEFYSRAFHASEAGMPEMATGHFLPFLVVTFASLARLRALLLRLQAKVKLVDIPAILELDHVWNDADDAIMQAVRADLVSLRDSILLVSDQTANITGPPISNEDDRHVQLLANIGLAQAAKKPKKRHVSTPKKAPIESKERSKSNPYDDDIGHKMTHAEQKGTPDHPLTTVDALDGNAEFLTMVREKEKSKKKRKEIMLKENAPKEKKRAKTKKEKKGDFFDELFG